MFETKETETRYGIIIPYRHVSLVLKGNDHADVFIDSSNGEPTGLSLSEYDDFMAGFKEWEARH